MTSPHNTQDQAAKTAQQKHTQGPWQFGDLSESIVTKFSPNIIATVLCEDGFEDEAQRAANGHLLAAAPDLLSACKFALQQLEGIKPKSGVHSSSLMADISIIKSAIARAEGRAS